MRYLLTLSLMALLACEETPNAPPKPAAKAQDVAAKPETPPTPVAPAAPGQATAPVSTGIDETAIDSSMSPCEDFYTYACGNWIKRTEIPADQSQWVRSFSEITERNEKILRGLLENLVKTKGQGEKNPYADKLAAFYSSCIDQDKIEKTAKADLEAVLKPIDAIKNAEALAKVLADIHLRIANPIFGFGSQQDLKDPNTMIAFIDQAGLGLPERDYYTRTDEKSKKLLADYVKHVEKMFVLAGDAPAKAKAEAAAVMNVENQLARLSMGNVERRDPNKTYHFLALAELEKSAPKFPWKVYFKDVGYAGFDKLNVAVPEFFAGVSKMIDKVPLPQWKTYLRWHVIHAAAPSLSRAFDRENFAFFGHTLAGTAEQPPRWKTCVRVVDGGLGEALGRIFVDKTFGEEGKVITQEIVGRVEEVMRAELGKLAWMDDATRKAAHEKVSTLVNKIGYPEKWRNYDSVKITDASLLKNEIEAGLFETKRQLDRIGKPVDRTEWLMTPPTVNAYYNPTNNEMAFPAGILQPPFYSRDAALAVNYGAIGMVMGHELTHGFDDEGRQFDAQGALHDWWSPAVNKEFMARAECVVEQFNGYVAIDDIHQNGQLTLGENIADLGGIKLAHAAYHAKRGAKPVVIPGAKFSDDQLFFLGFAQSWCAKTRDAAIRLRAHIDPHALPQYRVNGPLSNDPTFAEAFKCQAPAKMVREKRCEVW